MLSTSNAIFTHRFNILPLKNKTDLEEMLDDAGVYFRIAMNVSKNCLNNYEYFTRKLPHFRLLQTKYQYYYNHRVLIY